MSRCGKGLKMTGIIRLKEEIHSIVLQSRNIENILSTNRFERLWGDSTEEEKEQAVKYAKALDREKLRKWMQDHPSLELTEKPLTDLRKIARKMGIKYYAKLTYVELISAIAKQEMSNVCNKTRQD